jgi:phage gp36-like protein
VSTPLLYASLSDLRAVLSGTDAGIGTAAQLTDAQLTLCLLSGTNRVSAYVGSIFDGSTPQAVPPVLLHDLTLDIAAFWATGIYLKNKEIPSTHPVYLKYTETMKFLNDVRDGKVRFDPVVVGGIGEETGVVINRIPPIFSGDDSNTQLDPLTGGLEASTPDWMWAPPNDLLENWNLGPVYQG